MVQVGDKVKENDPLFIIEAMKMESTISAPISGEISSIELKEKTLVDQDDLVLTIDPEKLTI